MKKLILVFISLSLFSSTMFSQLTIKSVEEASGYKTIYEFGSKMASHSVGEIRYFNSSYVLLGGSNNQFEKTMHSIVLGSTKEEATESLRQLGEIKKNLHKSIVVAGAFNKNTTIYKNMGIVFSTDGVAGWSSVLYYLKPEKAIEILNNYKCIE